MKRTYHLILAVIVAFSLYSCSDDEEETTPTPSSNPNRVITATIDGKETTFVDCFRDELSGLYLYDGTTSDVSQAITVRAVINSTGTFTVDSSNSQQYSVTVADIVSQAPNYDAIPFTMTEGTLTVTKNSIDEFEGTFSGTVANALDPSDVKVVTNGSFTYK